MAFAFSRLGGRSLYTYSIPALLWLFDAGLARKMIAAWAVGFYVACCMRDLLWLPRLDQVTDAVEIIKPETQSEFGFPCVKSYSATLFPVLLTYLCWREHYTSIPAGMLLSCCWIFSVLASRVYLGVASLASVSGGAIIAVGTAGVWGLYGDEVDASVGNSFGWIALAQPIGVFLALVAYPIPWRHTATFQNAASVLGLASGFLFGSSFAVSGWLPAPLCEVPQPVYLYSSVVHASAVILFRLLLGVSITFAAKFVSERVFKQALSSVTWFVPRLSPSYIPLLSSIYPFEDLAFPMLTLLSNRPPTLRVHLNVTQDTGPQASLTNGHAPAVPGSVGSSTSPPDYLASKFRKRKPSKGLEAQNGAASPCPTPPVTAQGATTRVPYLHHGSPCTWYGLPLYAAFQRMLKVTTSMTYVALGPFSALAPASLLADDAASVADVDVVPNELHTATISTTAPMFASDAKRYCRVGPATFLSHFLAGIASAVLAPAFMQSFS